MFRALQGGLAQVLLCTAGLAQAATPSTTPQPRVLYGMHSAPIGQIRATPDRQRLVTQSLDKTLRVWRLSDLQLLRTLPLPSEPGPEGGAYTLAVAPDGQSAWTGGWTGLSWLGGEASQVYRVALDTGRLEQTLRGFKGSIETLAVSADGARLAVGASVSGLTVVDARSGERAWADEAYAGVLSFADFAGDGRLATTSHDGCLRIYGPEGGLQFRAQWPVPAGGAQAAQCKGSELGGVRFSPDGRWLAFGVQDRPEVVLMDAATMRVARVISVADPLQRSLCCASWSPDSATLYINGVHDGAERQGQPTPLYRVADSGRGTVTRLDVGRHHFTNMLPLPDGEMVFATDTPSLVRLDAQGRKQAEALPPNGDFRFADAARFRVSTDGRRVTLPMQATGGEARYFGLDDEPQRAYRAAAADDLANTEPPRRDVAGGVRVQTDLGRYSYKRPTTVNGHAVRLQPTQSVWSWATHAREAVAALGTGWSVVLVEAEGRTRWEAVLPAPAFQVALTGDGRWVVAALGDGSVRWLALDTGREMLGVFLHANGEDWVAWRPDGHYASSPRGDEYMGWVVNRGDGQAPDLLRAVQFERQLYRPDLVRLALTPGEARSAAGTADLGQVLGGLAAPRVVLERIEAAADGRLQLRFTAEATGRPIEEVGVYADGVPLLKPFERKPPGAEERQLWSGTLKLPQGLRPKRIRVEAQSDAALGLDELLAPAMPGAAPRARGKLWLLAIGVMVFEDTRRCGANCEVQLADLPNAPNDAQALAERLRQQAGGAFEEVQAWVLSDDSGQLPTRANIIARLKELEAAGPDDTVLVFVASHGLTGGQPADYYFVPRDARMADIAQLFKPGRAAPGSLVSASELSQALRRVAGRRLLVIDTCHSGAADGRSNPYTLAKRSASAQVAVLSAAEGSEQSYEAVGEPHGAFTQALLEALGGAADADRDGAVSVVEMFRHAQPRVAANTRALNESARKRNPQHRDVSQTPTLMAIPALEATGLYRDPKKSRPD